MVDFSVSQIAKGALGVVVGSGASGLAAAKLLHLAGAKVRIVDKNPAGFGEAAKAMAAEYGFEMISGEHQPEHFAGAALVVPSPGVPLKTLEPILAAAGSPDCISELEFASRFTTESCIAVTGTSGKTTTVSLMAAMLEEAGKRVFLGGNIGTPLSEYVINLHEGAPKADVLVLEVSSFQLQGTRAFHPHVAVLLNLSENHLDQHRDMAEYSAAKFMIFRNQTASDLAIIGESLFDEMQHHHLRSRVEYFAAPQRFTACKLLGRHNLANLEAAYMAVQEYGVSFEQAGAAVASFAPLPHRLELVAEKGGVQYVNDSKCTTVEALKVALESFERPVLLLAGGVFKGGDLDSLRTLIKEKVKAIGLFGNSREIFEAAWADTAPISWDAKLEGAVKRLHALAANGDAMLLAPATSSFDLYANYKARGNDFKKIVEELA